jgi:hypothetical protein
VEENGFKRLVGELQRWESQLRCVLNETWEARG